MFERRLKFFIVCLSLIAMVMIGRAAQLQMLQHAHWTSRAAESMKRTTFIETRRGKIMDVKGIPLAYDEACLDAAVDYRAISKDKTWIKSLAVDRLPPRSETNASGMSRAQLVNAEMDRVVDDIDAMWGKIAIASGKSLEEIEVAKDAIKQRVEMRRRLVWYSQYQKAVSRQENQGPSPWYKAWLFDDEQDSVTPDSIKITVAEEQQPHVILRNIDSDVSVRLTKIINQLPGLKLQQSTHRVYTSPADKVLCHSLGHMSLVMKEDLKRDPNLARDELRQYLPNDLIGKDGIEGAAERTLRGSKGRMDKYLGDSDWHETAKAVPGQDVQLSIDIELQAEIMNAFHEVHSKDNATGLVQILNDMHGAAVVIDVPTNEVRALVPFPNYDLNRFEADYVKLEQDQIDNPLLNRATCAQFPPGSTVKTIIGSTAITRGLLGVHEGIECTGLLMLPDDRGRVRKWGFGRCWQASMYTKVFGEEGAKHHANPPSMTHHGQFGNPDGFLMFSEALERSCNIFFETVADRLKLDGVISALSNFGLGRKTGIGILEMPGRLPHPAKIPLGIRRSETWLAGIGQGSVCATPIQMANVAATLARNGIWMRPKLILQQPGVEGQSERVDLHLAPEALAAVREGMTNVVNANGGTGREAQMPDILVAGKTGSAQQSSWFSILVKDNNGKTVHNPDGSPKRELFPPGNWPWYQAVGADKTHIAHAWLIGFAPADNPQIAFCVFVEYGGGGGSVGGPIVRDLIKACMKQGYLHSNTDKAKG